MTDARTVLSFPPLAPMATRSPRWKSEVEMMVSWTSVSKIERKQLRQSLERFLGRIITALVDWQLKQRVGAILVVGLCWNSELKLHCLSFDGG